MSTLNGRTRNAQWRVPQRLHRRRAAGIGGRGIEGINFKAAPTRQAAIAVAREERTMAMWVLRHAVDVAKVFAAILLAWGLLHHTGNL